MPPRKMKSLDAPQELGHDASARAPRRVFVERREIPGLVIGTARGDAAACRRVLGARRGGRIGFALALLGLALDRAEPARRPCSPRSSTSRSACSWACARARKSFQTTREVQRLALWTVLTPLGVAVLARFAGFGAPWHVFAAAVAGQLLLLRALRATRAR